MDDSDPQKKLLAAEESPSDSDKLVQGSGKPPEAAPALGPNPKTLMELGPLGLSAPLQPGNPRKRPDAESSASSRARVAQSLCIPQTSSLGVREELLESSSSDSSAGIVRDSHKAKSWSAGTRREVLMPLRPNNYNSFAPTASSQQAEEDMNASRTFGGISRGIRPTMPTLIEVKALARFVTAFKQAKANRLGEQKKELKIVAFVNSRSGGQAGELLMRTLSDNLSEEEDSNKPLIGCVCDLSQPNEPDATIEDLARDIKAGTYHDIRLLVCGGDGTVTWILTALEQCAALKGKLHLLPVAIVPLGTGNDLARSLGWGPKLTSVSDILTYLKWVVQATPVTLDQWRLVLRPHEELPENHKLRTMGSHPQLVSDQELAQQLLGDLKEALDMDPTTKSGPEDIYLGFWQNYFSLGVDAKVARSVDLSRSETCCGQLCFRNGCGKVCYGYQGLMHAAFGSILTREISTFKVTPPNKPSDQLEEMYPSLEERTVNGRRGRLRQLMFVNINSYGSGLKVLPDPGHCSRDPAPGDGVLEVLGLRNVLSGLAVFAGMTRPTYFCSAQAVAFRLEKGECLQSDGEPWRLPDGCDVLIELHRKVTMLRAPDEARWWKGNVTQSFWKEADHETLKKATLPSVIEIPESI